MDYSRREDILLGVFTVSVVAGLVALGISVGSTAPANAVRYDFLLNSALGLQKDNRVTVAGVSMGVVDRITVDGQMARLSLLLEPSLVVHGNAKAAVRARTLLGEKYVDLDPGGPPAQTLAPGATLAENVPTVEIDAVIRNAAELVSSFNEMTPTLRKTVDRLEGMLGTADLRALSKDVSALVKDSDAFFRNMEDNLGESTQDARVVLRELRTRLPGLLDRVNKTHERVDALLAAIPADSLESTVKKGPATLETTSVALQDLRVAMDELRATNQKTSKVLEGLDRLLGKANSLTEQQLREMIQVEGIRVNLITDPAIERRVRALTPSTSGVKK